MSLYLLIIRTMIPSVSVKFITRGLHFFLLYLLFFSSSLYGANTDTDPQRKITPKAVAATDLAPPKIGNFVLPSSQQPGAFLSFGQNIIDKNQNQLVLVADYLKGTAQHNADITPSVLHGITDNFSVFLSIPFSVSAKEEKHHSSGIEDTSLQFEYAFHNKKTYTFVEQATIVVNATFPTGSSTKVPATGFGAMSYFLGATFSRTYVEWFAFTSYGLLQPTSHHGTRFGTEFLYQFGLGRNILSITDQWIFAWLVEADGTYANKNKIRGIKDSNSGGNVVLVTPSLWISSKNIIFQIGIGFPAVQHLFGVQNKNRYLLATQFRWSF